MAKKAAPTKAPARRAKPGTAPTTKDLTTERLLYPAPEAARLLGRHRTTLYHLAREGRLELVRDGGRTYVTAAEIARFLANLERVEVAPRTATPPTGKRRAS